MLRLYPVILSYVADVAELVPRIAHHDPDLARQLRRSSASVVLNTAEGMYARGRSRTACYNIALRDASWPRSTACPFHGRSLASEPREAPGIPVPAPRVTSEARLR